MKENLDSHAAGTCSGAWMLCGAKIPKKGVAVSCDLMAASRRSTKKVSSYTHEPGWFACEQLQLLLSPYAGAPPDVVCEILHGALAMSPRPAPPPR